MENKKTKIVLLLVGLGLLFTVLLLFAFQEKEKEKYSISFKAMNVPITIDIYDTNEKRAKEALEEAKEIYLTWEEVLKEDGELKTIREHSSKEENLTISSELYEFLKEGKSWYEKTDQILNIVDGNAYAAWKEAIAEKRKPTKKELKESTAIDTLRLLSNSKIENQPMNIQVDFIKMGFVTEKVAQLLEKKGISSYLINAFYVIRAGEYYQSDGNYLLKIGSAYENEEKNTLSSVRFENRAIATKTVYQNAYYLKDERISYYLNPTTKEPIDDKLSVVVIAEDSLTAEAIATTLFLLPVPEGQQFLAEKYPDVAASWSYVTEDGVNRKVSTENFFNYISY